MALETKVISSTNLKGGVAKTTTSANLGAGLARMGYKVLLIDWDPQGNLTMHFGYDPDQVTTLYSALDTNEEDFVKTKGLKTLPITYYPENLFLLANNFILSKFEPMFSDASLGGGHMVLANVISHYQGKVDFVIIDCQPSLSLLTINAYYASDYLFIPVEVGVFSKNGMDKILNSLKRLNKNYKKDIKVGGVFFTRMEPNTVISNDYADYFNSSEEIPLMKSQIRKNVAIKECQELGCDIFTYDAKITEENKRRQLSNSNEDYYNFINEFLYLVGATEDIKTSRGLSENNKEKNLVNAQNKKKGALKDDFKAFLNS